MRKQRSAEPDKPAEPETKPDDADAKKPDDAPITVADFKNFATDLVGSIRDSIGGGFNAIAANAAAGNQPVTPTAPTPADFGFPTDAEWQAAEESGDPVQLARLQRRETRATAKQQAWNVEHNLINPLREQGQTAIAGVAAAQAMTGWDEYHKDERIKATVDKLIAGLDPAQRMQKESLQYCYDMALGMNYTYLKARDAEQAARATREHPGNTPGAHGRTAGSGTDNEPVDVEELIGGEDGRRAVKALNSHPKLRGDFDKLARAMGYKNGAEYAKRFGSSEVH